MPKVSPEQSVRSLNKDNSAASLLNRYPADNSPALELQMQTTLRPQEHKWPLSKPEFKILMSTTQINFPMGGPFRNDNCSFAQRKVNLPRLPSLKGRMGPLKAREKFEAPRYTKTDFQVVFGRLKKQ